MKHTDYYKLCDDCCGCEYELIGCLLGLKYCAKEGVNGTEPAVPGPETIDPPAED